MAPMLLGRGVERITIRAARALAAAGIVAVALMLPCGCAKQEPLAPVAAHESRAAPAPAQQLSAAGVAELHSILDAGKLDGLRWPDFSNYKTRVSELYATNGDRLAWIERPRPTPQALAMIRAIEAAQTKGLEPADYDGPQWPSRLGEFQRLGALSESAMIHFDVALSVSAMRYISDLHLGRVDPGTYHSRFDVERPKFDRAQFLLVRIARAPDIQPALAEIEPPFPAYQRTLEALAQYRKLAAEYKGEPFSVPKKSVKPGGSYSALPQLARFLRLLGDLPADAQVPAGDVYGQPLVDGVREFQVRHGLDPDGVLGRETLKELNTPLSERVEQIELTLERWRWLPHQFERPPIIVNIPEFRLHAMSENHRQVLTMKVVVGKAYGHKTPVFATEMDSVLFRPYWNVPYSIQRKEIVPDIRKNSDYLIKHNYQVVDDRRQVVSEGAVSAGLLDRIREGEVHVRQRPGPKNSLGLVKFDMPNPYDVYMHATPATSLFSKSRRDFSHGCIRVEDPVALAVWALRDNPGDWTADRVLEAMNGDKTFREELRKPVPVLIVYGTAVVADNGRVYFFSDVYRLDADLEKELAQRRPYPQPATAASRL
ncbi:MAG: L,D-transpeptidase family protein [Acidobacteriota bacterium]|nr:L,D-transpeptidase family protein [Acidobacteriota bacterium]